MSCTLFLPLLVAYLVSRANKFSARHTTLAPSLVKLDLWLILCHVNPLGSGESRLTSTLVLLEKRLITQYEVESSFLYGSEWKGWKSGNTRSKGSAAIVSILAALPSRLLSLTKTAKQMMGRAMYRMMPIFRRSSMLWPLSRNWHKPIYPSKDGNGKHTHFMMPSAMTRSQMVTPPSWTLILNLTNI